VSLKKIRPDTQVVVQSVVAEGYLWCLVGAKALQELVTRIGSTGLRGRGRGRVPLPGL
jgi:hypothetical protein